MGTAGESIKAQSLGNWLLEKGEEVLRAQSWPNLCDPMDCSLPDSSVQQWSKWVSEWVKLLSRVWLFVTPLTAASQAPPSMGFSRQEYWSGLSFLSPGDLPNPEIEPTSPVSPSLAGSFFITESPGKRGRGWQKQHMDPGRPSSYLQHPSSHHNQWFCPSAEPSWGCTLMRELGQEQFCLIQILR